ncbi:hypothetical protein UA08_05507 [Talaromyces atroroseus]|uniref:Uncharacterized protein n=1 Tax=Talaromyces atroroseus TaxID=1441469 RepID=A0A225AFA4_TALAT|nr:hypothetical protein UA08_05507 [Talaromyces atroroseus]OKL59260.1 hypothetical protein UA08_05507 [Talaromyces atroroseus]
MSFPSFAPWDITPTTFAQLLDCYPATLKESYKRKLIAVVARKHRKYPERLNREDPAFDRQTNEYLQLDDWRYETLPRVLRQRAGEEGGDEEEKEEEKEESDGDDKKKKKKSKNKNNKKNETVHLKQGEKYDSLFMHKDELVKLMDWKLKHGRYRPALAGLIKTNKPELVRKTTAEAYKALVDSIDTEPSRESLDETFPKKSQDILMKPLRAVGTATASLILAVRTEGRANEIPFYSDEVYNWLCLDLFPGSEKNRWNYKKATNRTREDGRLDVKYNMLEYRELYEEVCKLRHHLNNYKADDDDDDDHKARRQFSCSDVERVAYVLRNLDVSGFPHAAEILEKHAAAESEAKKEFEKNKRSKRKSGANADDDEPEEEEILGVVPSKKRKAGFKESGRGKKKKV